MAKLEQILQKKYKDKLLKISIYKKKLVKMQEFLKTFKITCNPKDDVSFFQCELLYESIYNKKRLEDCFMVSYVEMQDFWNDLDYKERTHLVHVDIERKCSDLKYFNWLDKRIYMPVFDMHLNHVYTDEIISLELKQYRLLTREFREIIQYNTYGSLPYRENFSSAQWIADGDQGYCLYFSRLNRYYHIIDEQCVHILSLDPERRDALSYEERGILALLFMKNDEKAMAEMIITHDCVDERCKNKIQRNLHKLT